MSLNTPNGQVELLIWCNESANAAYWLANDAAVTAGSVIIVNQVRDRDRAYGRSVHNDLVNGGGAQDSHELLDAAGKASSGAMEWEGIFTANQGGTVSQWEVVLTNLGSTSGGDCTAMVQSSNAGTQQVVVVP